MVFLEFDESEQQPEDTGADEYADYAELAAYSDEGQDENQKSAQINLSEVFRPGLGIPECKQDKADACGTDERDNSRAQSVQDAADRPDLGSPHRCQAVGRLTPRLRPDTACTARR